MMSSDEPRNSRIIGTPSQGNRAVKSSTALYDFIQRDGNTWSTGKISMSEFNKMDPIAEILIVFLPEVTEIIDLGEKDKISARFGIHDGFWSPIAKLASGYFDCHEIRDTDGKLDKLTSHFRFLIKEPLKTTDFHTTCKVNSHVWHKVGFCTAWSSRSNIILCFGLPSSLQNSMSTFSELQHGDPFALHTLCIEKVLLCYDTALWAWRDCVREIEQTRAIGKDPQPAFVYMHEIARHIIHSSETLAMAIETITSLIQEFTILFEEPLALPKSIIHSNHTKRALRSQTLLFKCLHLRSKALEERLRNEINLAFNLVAQDNGRITVQISKSTRVDSAAMKTISILGLAYLPGTFICAIFSTSFFNFTPATSDQSQWTVSEDFWIYWAVSIPITAVTIACWVFWQRAYVNHS